MVSSLWSISPDWSFFLITQDLEAFISASVRNGKFVLFLLIQFKMFVLL